MSARGWQIVTVIGIVALVFVIWTAQNRETQSLAAQSAPVVLNAPATQPAPAPMVCPMHGMPMPCPMCMQMMAAHQMQMQMQPQAPHMPLIGEPAPAFHATTTAGDIDFPKDYAGKWVILFSHPADFTPVCTTEFMTFQTMLGDFKALNCELIGLSIDSNFSHIAWLRKIETMEWNGMKNVAVTFPVISDIRMEVASKYGMVQPTASTTQAVRAVFFIDPEGKIRALIYYPLSNGRNFAEIKRLLIAMQTTDKYHVSTPANWQPGDDVIVPPPGSCGAAADRVKDPGPDTKCLDWFLTFKKLPLNSVAPPAK